MESNGGTYTCDGIYSCSNHKSFDQLNDLNIYFDCNGYHSCDNIYFETVHFLYTFGIASELYLKCNGVYSCSQSLTINEKSSAGVVAQLYFSHSFSSINNTIKIVNKDATFYLNNYYSLYNTSIICSNYSRCRIYCQNNYTLQHFITIENISESTIDMDPNCQNTYTDNNNEVSLNLESDNTTTSIINILQNIEESVKQFSTLCNNNERSQTSNIGYPNEAEESIINVEVNGVVCCQGYRSCFSATSITANFGHVLCSGSFSCSKTTIWNSDSSNNNNNNNNNNSANVYCLGMSACLQSVIRTESDIYCLGSSSCDGGVILEASRIVCTNEACSDANINSVSTVYLIDSQPGIVVFSRGIGKMTVYLRGYEAGDSATIYCNENDYCTIDCGVPDSGIASNACENTIVYCFGKCTIICNDSIAIDNENITSTSTGTIPIGNVACPIVELSRSPTAAPTGAPTIAPTIYPTSEPSNTPTKQPTAALTANDIEQSMQWTLSTICGVGVILIIAGCIDDRIIGNNELFDFKAIIVFVFYVTDFFSGNEAIIFLVVFILFVGVEDCLFVC